MYANLYHKYTKRENLTKYCDTNEIDILYIYVLDTDWYIMYQKKRIEPISFNDTYKFTYIHNPNSTNPKKKEISYNSNNNKTYSD